MASENLPTTEDGKNAGDAGECDTMELTKYYANPEAAEEVALICIAEGWNATRPPTRKQLEYSYYRKAFERMKSGGRVCSWNWAAGL
ncbi:MAG: hypothetical protein LBQ43_02650, partial [Holosporales bacterium]|nr:hypothetical protein [Holosporales bacterium]